MELIIKEIHPATVESNILQIDNFINEVKEKYTNLVITEDEIAGGKEARTTLNKLEKNLAEARKRIQTEGLSEVEKVINKLKESEKEVKLLSSNIKEQLDNYEEKRKEQKIKEIHLYIDDIFILKETVSLKKYVEFNEKWLNKTYSKVQIQEEIAKQRDELLEKRELVLNQIEEVNKEIQNKMKFEDINFSLSSDAIFKFIIDKKEQIKNTEKSMREQAEKEKQEAIARSNKEIENLRKQVEEKEKIEKSAIKEEKQHTENDLKLISFSLIIQNAEYYKAKLLKEFLDDNKINYIFMDRRK